MERPVRSVPAEPAVASRWFALFFCLALTAAVFKIVFHLGFALLPLLLLGTGAVIGRWNRQRALRVFFALLPVLSATPDLQFNGYPFNLMGIPLFLLAGMVIGDRLTGRRLDWHGRWVPHYLLFLVVLFVSAGFVFLRWSNLFTAGSAVLADTPVSPAMDRVSFASIYPVATLFLFAVAPFLGALLREAGWTWREVLAPTRVGFVVSLGIALGQKTVAPWLLSQAWWGERMRQVNGGFSDFNAFGFFAGTLLLMEAFAWLSSHERGRGGMAHWGRLVLLAPPLLGVFLSGSRAAFLFVLAAAGGILASKRLSVLVRGGLLAAGILLVMVFGGILKDRLVRSFDSLGDMVRQPGQTIAAQRFWNTRQVLAADGWRMVRRHPLAGVGAGNFLFYRQYLYGGRPPFEDLPLNHYLLILIETGLPGILLFLVFLAGLVRIAPGGAAKTILLVQLATLLLNNFFWFPECLLMFWAIAAGGPPAVPVASLSPRKMGRAAALLVAWLVGWNLFDFERLHPREWARQTRTAYDYGLWYAERGAEGRFHWSGARAGIYLPAGPKAPLSVTCQAPLARLAGGRQRVTLAFRGHPLRSLEFRQPGTCLVPLADLREGWLEFRVEPTFNLAEMGLGPETRTLGVQVAFAEGATR